MLEKGSIYLIENVSLYFFLIARSVSTKKVQPTARNILFIFSYLCGVVFTLLSEDLLPVFMERHEHSCHSFIQYIFIYLSTYIHRDIYIPVQRDKGEMSKNGGELTLND